LIILSCATKL